MRKPEGKGLLRRQWRRWENNIKISKWHGTAWRGTDSSGSEQWQVAGFCDSCNES